MNNFEQCDIHTVDAFPREKQMGRILDWQALAEVEIESPPYYLVRVSRKGRLGKVLLGLQRYVLYVFLSWQ